VNTRETKRRQTKKRILHIALQLFARNGINATRTLDIAGAAGVSHGTVFAHFPTREHLVHAAIELFAARVIQRMHETLDQRDGLRAGLEAHLGGLIEYEQFYTQLVIENPRLPSPTSTLLVGIQSAVAEHLRAAYRKDRERCAVREMSFELLFATWLGLLHHHLVNRELHAQGASVLERHGPELLDYFVGLITLAEPEANA